jgi:hypothetical protein
MLKWPDHYILSETPLGRFRLLTAERPYFVPANAAN